MNTKDKAISGNVSTERALDLALEALEMAHELEEGYGVNFKKYGLEVDKDIRAKYATAIAAIKQARSAPYVASPRVQEPAAWMDVDENGAMSSLRYWSEPDNRHEAALYTTPPGGRQSEDCLTAAPVQGPAFYRHEDGHLMTPDRAKFLGFDLDDLQALYTTPPGGRQSEDCLTAAPVPDALTDQDPETPEYREGWNDCRAFMLNWGNNP
jgi:hypothetical protein